MHRTTNIKRNDEAVSSFPQFCEEVWKRHTKEKTQLIQNIGAVTKWHKGANFSTDCTITSNFATVRWTWPHLLALSTVTFDSPPPSDIPVVTVTTYLQHSCIPPPRVPPGGHTFPRRSAPNRSPQWPLHFRFMSPPTFITCPAVSWYMMWYI